jgi:hypothetical protein
MQAPAPSEKFLEALTSRGSISHSALPKHISHFYREALHLRTSFENDDSGSIPRPYAGLISVFDSQVTVMGADLAKPQDDDVNSILFHIDPEKRLKEGEPSFVQDGMVGFRRNWAVFSQQSLSGLNWYISFS